MKMNNESDQARRQRLIDRRRCIECERKLSSGDRGALCSECYFGIITDPGLADPVRPSTAAIAGVGAERMEWRTG